jgi:hypothetical protein
MIGPTDPNYTRIITETWKTSRSCVYRVRFFNCICFDSNLLKVSKNIRTVELLRSSLPFRLSYLSESNYSSWGWHPVNRKPDQSDKSHVAARQIICQSYEHWSPTKYHLKVHFLQRTYHTASPSQTYFKVHLVPRSKPAPSPLQIPIG